MTNNNAEKEGVKKSLNFVEQIIEDDLSKGKNEKRIHGLKSRCRYQVWIGGEYIKPQ